MTSADLDRFKTTGIWAEPAWFAAPQMDEHLGIRRHLRLKAVRGLLRAFPPEVCVRIARDESLQSFGPIIVLFGAQFPGLINPLIALGIDLEDAGVTDAEVLGRLTHRANHEAAAFEVRVQASLRRAGHFADRIPASAEARRPDLLTAIDGIHHDVEIKLAHASEVDRAAHELEEALLQSGLHIAGYELEWQGTRKMMERLFEADDAGAAARGLQREIIDAFAPWKDRRVLPAEIPITDLGTLRVGPRPGLGRFSIGNLGELSEDQKARRVARMIRRDGVAKFDGSRPGLLVVGIHHAAKHHLVEQLVREDARANPDAYSRCRMVVLTDRVNLPRSRRRWPVSHAFLLGSDSMTRPSDVRWAVSVASATDERGLLVGPLSPDGRRVDVDTTRPRRSTVMLAHGEMAPNETTRIHIDFETGQSTVSRLPAGAPSVPED